MAGSFVELEDTIAEDLRIDEWPQTQVLRDILEWLDKHRDQVPGRTMTQSRFDELSDQYHAKLYSFQHLVDELGITVYVPKPTNAEKLRKVLDTFEVDEQNLDEVAELLDKAGVKAPGGDDE